MFMMFSAEVMGGWILAIVTWKNGDSISKLFAPDDPTHERVIAWMAPERLIV
jgi:hypothetical protein